MEVTFCTSINKTGVPKYGLEHFGSVVATQSGSIKSDFLDEFLTHISFLSPFFSSTPTTTNLLKYRPSVLDFEKNKYVCEAEMMREQFQGSRGFSPGTGNRIWRGISFNKVPRRLIVFQNGPNMTDSVPAARPLPVARFDQVHVA